MEIRCPVIHRTYRPDGSYTVDLVDESWPGLILVDDEFAAVADRQYFQPDDTGLTLVMDNAHARYRKMGQHRLELRTLYELEEGHRD